MKIKKCSFASLVAALCALPLVCGAQGAEDGTVPLAAESELSADEARAIAKEAFIYGFPMVVNYKTMYQYSCSVPGSSFSKRST